jgi:hypothetical protein
VSYLWWSGQRFGFLLPFCACFFASWCPLIDALCVSDISQNE